MKITLSLMKRFNQIISTDIEILGYITFRMLRNLGGKDKAKTINILDSILSDVFIK
jgi:hypothetical protein